MNIEIPSSDIGDAHIVSAELRRLHIPNDILTIRVLVANFDQRCRDSIHSLSVYVQSVPWIRELDHRICLKGLLEQYAFDRDAEVNESQGRRDLLGSQLQLNGGEVASRAGTVVDQVETGARDLETFLHHLEKLDIKIYFLKSVSQIINFKFRVYS